MRGLVDDLEGRRREMKSSLPHSRWEQRLQREVRNEFDHEQAGYKKNKEVQDNSEDRNPRR